jgi:hypothetical protein
VVCRLRNCMRWARSENWGGAISSSRIMVLSVVPVNGDGEKIVPLPVPIDCDAKDLCLDTYFLSFALIMSRASEITNAVGMRALS